MDKEVSSDKNGPKDMKIDDYTQGLTSETMT